MESNVSQYRVIFGDLLPFMNERFFHKFLSEYGVEDRHIKVTNNSDKLPFEANVIFPSIKAKETFFAKIKEKNMYPNYNCQINIKEENKQEEIIESDRNLITFPIAYDKMIENYYEITSSEPGLIFLDKELMDKQSSVIGFLIKKMGSNLISGKSIMSISLPVNIFDKRTLLQVYAYELSYSPPFLYRAFYSINPADKIKCVSAFLISQLSLSPLQTKPFSPILGETYQCKIGSINVYAEHTASKPLTSNIYAFDDDKLFKIYGHITTDASTGINTCKAIRKGQYIVEFKDGYKYELTFPKIIIKGLTVGKRLFNFRKDAIVIDRKSNLATLMTCNPDEKGALASFFSSKQKSNANTVRGSLISLSDLKFEKNGKVKKKKDAKVISTIDCEWTDHLYFENDLYWKSIETSLVPMRKQAYTLPSDSSIREDLNYLLSGDEKEAQEHKEKYEEIQRNDRTLRENFQSVLNKNKKK